MKIVPHKHVQETQNSVSFLNDSVFLMNRINQLLIALELELLISLEC